VFFGNRRGGISGAKGQHGEEGGELNILII
jgi:hypothetical protein